jgi:hypothetical protein
MDWIQMAQHGVMLRGPAEKVIKFWFHKGRGFLD